MAGPAYVHEPSVQYLHQLLDELARGHLRIPRFQRAFVWSDDQRLELLRSIAEGIPIGSVLVWRTEHTTLQTIDRIGPHALPAGKPALGIQSYLLDGLQRLSTLYGCLRPLPSDTEPYVVDDGEETSWNIVYDLSAQQFEILARGDLRRATHLPLYFLLDSIGLLKFQRGLLNEPNGDELVARADALAETFRTYKIPIVPLVTGDLATATRTFERINRQGTPMSELHMVRALTWTESFDLTAALEEVAQALSSDLRWGVIEPEWILKVCKAICDLDIAVENPEATAEALQTEPQEILRKVQRALHQAIEWLRSECHIDGYSLLPYRQQLVMAADWFHRSGSPGAPPEAMRELKRWFWTTTFTDRFSGITGGQTEAMLKSVRAIRASTRWTLRGKSKTPTYDVPAKMNASWVRNRTAAVVIASLHPLGHDGSPTPARLQLAERGLDALVPLHPKLKTIAGRIFLPYGDDTLVHLLLHATEDVPAAVLTSHAITAEAAAALQAGNLEAFETLRKEELRRLQEALYRSALGASSPEDETT